MTPPAIAGDVSLHVLDDEGILFAELRQELHSMNTAATLLWCLLEDGLSLEQMVERYAATFRIDATAAWRHVAPTLRRWYALGHMSSADLPDASDTSFCSALAFLLTNEELRRAFRQSAADVARAIAVEHHDREAFLALDPDAVEQQARDIAELPRRHRLAPVGTCTVDATDLFRQPARIAWDVPTTHRTYRLVDTTFRLTMPGEVEARAHAVLAHLAGEQSEVPDVDLQVRKTDGHYVIFEGLMPLVPCDTLEMVVPALKALLRRLALARYRYFMEIHAGVVVFGSHALLLPGAAGHGKTTMTAALVHAGGRYFSDEIALLEDTTLDVRPVPLTLTIKPGSVGPLRERYPHLDALHGHLREDRQPVRYLPPPVESRCAPDEPSRPVRWVVFPRYEPGIDTALVPLKRAHGFRRLLDESLVLPGPLDRRRVERLVEWARQLEFYELPHSSLDTAVSTVMRMAG